jgi:hypothetical protein
VHFVGVKCGMSELSGVGVENNIKGNPTTGIVVFGVLVG